MIPSPVIPNKRWKSHRQLFHPSWGSSVWCTDGCVGMTGCLCIYHQCKHLWFNKGRQLGRLQSTDCAKLFGLYHTVRQFLLSKRVKQLSVALPRFVCDDWGGDHWSMGRSDHLPLSTVLVQQSGLG